MQTNYKMIGADGVEYGPVTLNELRGWIAEGRVVGSTHVRRDTEPNWSTASNYPELGVTDRVGESAAAPLEDSAEAEGLAKRIKGGASWFYWIAALTLINSIAALAGGNWSFVLGLTITQIIDAAVVAVVPAEFSLLGKGIALAVDLMAVGLFVILGVMAGRKRLWAFAVGVTLYGLDTLLTFLSFSILSIGIHGWAMFCLIVGLKAARQWSKLGIGAQPASIREAAGSQPAAADVH